MTFAPPELWKRRASPRLHESNFLCCFSGSRLINVTNMSETSTLTLDPSIRVSSSFSQSAASRPGSSDASKVVSRGSGLSKASVGQGSSFTLDCSKAGKTFTTEPRDLSEGKILDLGGSCINQAVFGLFLQGRTCSWWECTALKPPVRRFWSNTWGTCSTTSPISWRNAEITSWSWSGVTITSQDPRLTLLCHDAAGNWRPGFLQRLCFSGESC